ncbi:MAG: tRNA pseudouridine(38-40) synthase TruA [Deltaproteobacteria bacterium]|nr:tRNA pseudouridine(38-40) synthase TruA [Deltaproteobacteria bacterium]
MNIKLIVEYDGTRYHGWQTQPNTATIQETLEKAISTFLGTPTKVTGSGRTDAGVHALGQVVNFHCEREYTPHRMRRALNALTPEDITIKEVEVVPEEFDARRDGRCRVYEYWILNRPTASPFYLNRALHVHEPLDVAAMQHAIECLVGKHDFSSFRAAGCDALSPVREVYQISLKKRGELWVFRIEATAFLRHMVRNIIGTLLEVGRGARTVENFSRLLVNRDRTQAGPTATPQGLYLVEVRY